MADANCRVFVRRHDGPASDERRTVRLTGQSIADNAVGNRTTTPTRVDRYASHALAQEAFVQRIHDLEAAGWSECDQLQ